MISLCTSTKCLEVYVDTKHGKFYDREPTSALQTRRPQKSRCVTCHKSTTKSKTSASSTPRNPKPQTLKPASIPKTLKPRPLMDPQTLATAARRQERHHQGYLHLRFAGRWLQGHHVGFRGVTKQSLGILYRAPRKGLGFRGFSDLGFRLLGVWAWS